MLTNGTFENVCNARHKFNKLWQIRQCLPKVCYQKTFVSFMLIPSKLKITAKATASRNFPRRLLLLLLPVAKAEPHLMASKWKWKCYFINYTCPPQQVIPTPLPCSFKLKLRLGETLKGNQSRVGELCLCLSYATCCSNCFIMSPPSPLPLPLSPFLVAATCRRLWHCVELG